MHSAYTYTYIEYCVIETNRRSKRRKKTYKNNNKNHYSQNFPFSWFWWCNSFWIDSFILFCCCCVMCVYVCVSRHIFLYSLHFFLQIRVSILLYVSQNILKVLYFEILSKKIPFYICLHNSLYGGFFFPLHILNAHTLHIVQLIFFIALFIAMDLIFMLAVLQRKYDYFTGKITAQYLTRIYFWI